MSANMLHCMFENQDPELQVFFKYFYYKVVPMVQALKRYRLQDENMLIIAFMFYRKRVLFHKLT